MSSPRTPKSSRMVSRASPVFDHDIPDNLYDSQSCGSSLVSSPVKVESLTLEEMATVVHFEEQRPTSENPLPRPSPTGPCDVININLEIDTKLSRPSLTINMSVITQGCFLKLEDFGGLAIQDDPDTLSKRADDSAEEYGSIQMTRPRGRVIITDDSPYKPPQPRARPCLSVSQRRASTDDNQLHSILQCQNAATLSMSTSNQSPLVEYPASKQRYKQYFAAGKRSNDENLGSPKIKRLSAGLRLRGRFHLHRAKSVVSHHSPDGPQYRQRSTSADSWRDRQTREKSHPNTTNAEKIAPHVWSMTAESGVGLKAQRLSLELPDDLDLQVVDLYTLYAEQNKLLGRHTKSVGKGATANVRLVHKKGDHSGEVYAAKEFRGKTLSEASEEYEKKVRSEYCIAKSVHHPNIVETFSLCTHHGRWIQVMEFCDQGDLFSLVNQKYLSSDEHLVDRLCLFKQLVQGLNYLHENGIAHRDVKLENLLLTKQSKLKITDFGVSEVFSGQHPGLASIDRRVGQDKGEVGLCAPGVCGSLPYIAPEVIAKQGEYDPRPLDVWGAAVVMLCMCANGSLWEKAAVGVSPIYDSLVKGWTKWNSEHAGNPGITETDYPHVGYFDSHINPPALRRLLLSMLNPDPVQRVTMASVASNRWLKVVECCQSDAFEIEPVEIDAAKSPALHQKKMHKAVLHNHQPPQTHAGHKLGLLHGSPGR